MNWYCVYKSQEEGYILTEIPQKRILTGTEFWTCDLQTQICFNTQSLVDGQQGTFSFILIMSNTTFNLED